MACTNPQSCPLCVNKVTRDIVNKCIACKKQRTDKWQYAAINSVTLTTGVPLISHSNTLLSPPHQKSACIHDTSPLSTFISLFSRLRNVNNVIHFGKPHFMSCADLVSVTDSLKPSGRPSFTAVVNISNNTPHSVYTSSLCMLQPYSETINDVILSIMQDEDTLCWHWNHDSTMTALQFQREPKGLWISYNGCEHSKRARLSGSTASVVGVPLHSSPLSGDTISLNIGSPSLNIKNTITGSYSELVKSTASEYLNCIMKTSRCFSCSAICDVHERLKLKGRQSTAPELLITLSSNFAECLKV